MSVSSIAAVPTAPALSVPAGPSSSAPNMVKEPAKRLELETLIREFQAKLGNNWDKYHEALSLFLVGRLSRVEMVRAINPILKNGLVKYHNKLLLLNFANSLKDGPLDLQNEFATFWNKKSSKSKNVKSSQYEKFKQNIMGLPIRERRRIKNITKDSGKKGKLSASITLTRHSLLPKIPMIQDKEQQQLQVNNLVQWQQDVVNGINSSLSTENYELPDADNLSRHMLMTMREYGLTGGLHDQVLEVVLLGLEAHLKNIIESAIDVAKYRVNKYAKSDFLASTLSNEGKGKSEDGEGDESKLRKRKLEDDDMNSENKKVTLSIEDMYDTFEMFPHLIEPCGPRLRLSNVMLQNDDMVSHGLDYDLPPKPQTPAAEPKVELLNSAAVATNLLKTTEGSASKEGETAPANENQPNKNHKDGAVKKEADSTDSKQPPADQNGSNSSANSQQKSAPDTSHIGTHDELKWVLHDLISTM